MSKHQFGKYPAIAGGNSERQVCDCKAVFAKRGRTSDEEEHLMNEAFTLRSLRANVEADALPFLPQLAGISEAGASWENQFAFLDGFYNLREVVEEHGPLDQRDAAWMFRRLLVAIGHAGKTGILHCAPIPEHVLIHPTKHGLVLCDWSHAITMAEEEPSMWAPIDYVDWYPPEWITGGDVGPGTDIYMAAKTMLWLIGGDPVDWTMPDDATRETRAFFTALLAPNIENRPEDAFRVLGFYDDLLEKLYGPRRFRAFQMSSKPGALRAHV